MTVTALYASILTLFYIALSFRVINIRRSDRISVGDGANPSLMRRMRIHGNFAEYVPLGLILMALIESMNVDRLIVHALGVTLLAGRIAHAYGLASDDRLKYRTVGMVLTFVCLICGALLCAFGALWHGM